MNSMKKLLLISLFFVLKCYSTDVKVNRPVSQPKGTLSLIIPHSNVIKFAQTNSIFEINSFFRYQLWFPTSSVWGQFRYRDEWGNDAIDYKGIDNTKSLMPKVESLATPNVQYGGSVDGTCCAPTISGGVSEIDRKTFQSGTIYGSFQLAPIDANPQQPVGGCASDLSVQKLYPLSKKPLLGSDVLGLISSFASLHFGDYLPTMQFILGSDMSKTLTSPLFTIYFNLAAQDQGQIFAKEILDF
jgi:hypothetical protein